MKRKTIKEIKLDKIERQEQVREMFLKNVPTSEMAKKFGVALSTIRRDIQELGIRKNNSFIDGQIIKLHLEGYNNTEIGYEIGLSRLSVGNILRKYGYGNEARTDDTLIDENTKYADNRVVLEKVTIDGKLYTDITPVFAPR